MSKFFYRLCLIFTLGGLACFLVTCASMARIESYDEFVWILFFDVVIGGMTATAVYLFCAAPGSPVASPSRSRKAADAAAVVWVLLSGPLIFSHVMQVRIRTAPIRYHQADEERGR
jgi:hypothetical protein